MVICAKKQKSPAHTEISHNTNAHNSSYDYIQRESAAYENYQSPSTERQFDLETNPSYIASDRIETQEYTSIYTAEEADGYVNC